MDDNTPLYNSRILNSYLRYLRKVYPEHDPEEILRYAGVSPHQAEDPGFWLSQRQADRFHEMLLARTGNPEIAREAGRSLASSGALGSLKIYALGLLSVSDNYMLIGRAYPLLSRGATARARKLSASSVEITTTPAPGVVEKPYQCANRTGTLEAMAKLFTGELARVEHPACLHRGDDCCRYRISWTPKRSLRWRRICNLSLPLGALAAVAAFWLLPSPVFSGFVAALGLGLLALTLYSGSLERRDLQALLASEGRIARSIWDADNLRHSSGQLFQRIGAAATRIGDLQRFFRATLEAMQSHLTFERGFILLVDPQTGRLNPADSYGFEEDQRPHLQAWASSLEFPGIQNDSGQTPGRRPALVFSRYEETDSQLGLQDREALARLGIYDLICEPIVFDQENLGMVAVANLPANQRITQSDFNLLSGIAAQTAVTIINNRSFQRLQESQERYRLVAENASDTIWMLDLEGRFVFVSPACEKLVGYRPEELLGQTIDLVLPAEALEQAHNLLGGELEAEAAGRVDDPKRTRTLELEHRHRDGHRLWAEIHVSFARDAHGRPQRIIGVTRDITERRRLAEELRQSQKMLSLGTLAGGIAHDFNNILFSILGHTEIAIEDARSDPQLAENLQEIFKAANRAKDLVQQILTFSRRAAQDRKPILLQTVVAESLKLLRASIPRTIALHARVDEQCGTVQADPTQIHQVVMNLCTNAYQALETSGGRIDVVLEPRTVDAATRTDSADLPAGPCVRLAVADNGPGIPSEIVERIFEPYFTTKATGQGTGLGLSVVHGIVKSHGGEVRVHSRPGHGSTFEVYLPVVPAAAMEVATPSTAALPTGRERILLVDDEDALVAMETQMLERLGYTVTPCNDPREALQRFAAAPDDFDLVLTDMTMPEMTGIELSRALFAIRPQTPIVLCTGFSREASPETARQLGIGAFVTKPIDRRQLARTIRKAIDGESQ